MSLLSGSPVSIYLVTRVCNNLEFSSCHRLSYVCSSNNQEPCFSSECLCHRGIRVPIGEVPGLDYQQGLPVATECFCASPLYR